MMGSSGMGLGWYSWGLFWLALLGLVIWAVVRLLPRRQQVPGALAARETPEDILYRRFTRGEIDLETYQSQRAALARSRGDRHTGS